MSCLSLWPSLNFISEFSVLFLPHSSFYMFSVDLPSESLTSLLCRLQLTTSSLVFSAPWPLPSSWFLSLITLKLWNPPMS